MVNNNNRDFLAYFNNDVLNDYRNKPDIFTIDEDDYGGKIENISWQNSLPSPGWFNVRYAYRKLHDDEICIAAFIPDLNKLSDDEKKIWAAYEIEKPKFSGDDEVFQDWKGVYLSPGGKFPDIENFIRPKANIYLQIRLINAITKITFNKTFFNKEENPSLKYPSAENTKAFRDSIVELYQLIIDEMNQNTIAYIASRLGVTLTDSTKRLNSLKEILPNSLVDRIHKPIKSCSDIRNKIHGIPSLNPTPCKAHEMFNEELVKIGNALIELKIFLEDMFNVDSQKCLRRLEMKGLFPELELTDNLIHIFKTVTKAEGKTIEKIEYGKQQSSPKSHKSEGLIFHFTDGTSMSVIIGSNAQNLSSDHEDIKPNDVHTDLMFFWAPDIKKIN